MSPLMAQAGQLYTSSTDRVHSDRSTRFGNDGTWSTLTARIGSPPQPVFVLAGTSTAVTTVAGFQWCDNTTLSGYTCADRGRAFDKSKSTTWEGIGHYTLNIRPELTKGQEVYGVTDYGYGEYGRDSLKFVDGEKEVMLDDQVVAVVNDSTILLGSLGLGVETRSFSNEESYEGLLVALYKSGVVPSRSFGYTAGNYHQSPKRPVDLVLGGHNTGQYRPNTLSMKLDANSRPIATLETITVSATGNPPWGPGSQDLLITPVSVEIDSFTPFLGLPEEACRRFEQNLGLIWNSTLNLYLVDETTREKLNTLNVTFQFTLAESPGSRETVEIAVSYSSLDLEIGWPFINETGKHRYFPLKRAAQDGQVTLGRAFLQEAYLIVDHERGNFSIHQALQIPGRTNIVPILHPTDVVSIPQSSDSSNSLSTGVIAGIGAGVGILILIIIILSVIFLRRRRAAQIQSKVEPETTFDEQTPDIAEVQGDFSPFKSRPFSSDSTTLTNPATTELQGDNQYPSERHELSAVNLNPAELDGQQSWSFIKGGGFRRGHPPQQVVELPDTPPATRTKSIPQNPDLREVTHRPISQIITPSTAEGPESSPPWSPMSPLTPDSQTERDRTGRF
ncbi:acid protease [Ascodesmis nigricans]|uniref:Acid protease n=1 Tax=Ascodesmis nigricans TaxID=341454 RepID=A0A4S2MW60_9PEZI|nr:acid protease [Ascodesmis nigricans]